jgi:tetratricopeptide (TPR) repeat protein
VRPSLAAAAIALVATLVHAAPEWITSASGLRYAITSRGSGPLVHEGQVIEAHYAGHLADGTEFDSSYRRKQPIAFTLGAKQVIRGWDEGFALLHVGDQATFVIPPDIAYGEKGRPPVIPPSATLAFDVELVAVHDHALSTELDEAFTKGGLDELRRRYAELEGRIFSGYYVSEAQLNGLGYRLLGRGNNDAAIAVFEWTAARFPASANAYDSLGEALAKSGDRERAITSYRKALEIDPSFANAAQELKRIEGR